MTSTVGRPVYNIVTLGTDIPSKYLAPQLGSCPPRGKHNLETKLEYRALLMSKLQHTLENSTATLGYQTDDIASS